MDGCTDVGEGAVERIPGIGVFDDLFGVEQIFDFQPLNFNKNKTKMKTKYEWSGCT